MTNIKPLKTQSDKFKQAARELETDNDEKRFDKMLGKIATSKKAGDEDAARQSD